MPVPKQQKRLARYVCADPGWHKFVRRLCIMPKGPVPKVILSKKRLHETWSASRDATSRPASAGIDQQTAKSFAQNLDANIARLNLEIVQRKFGFSDLRAVPIPKENGKKRIICIPTVRDRLVQRAIVTWLVQTRKVPHQDFVYGIKGQGLRKAINEALRLRPSLEWCVKTDIQAFFDNIRRDKLKLLISQRLRDSSVVPLLNAAIDREIRPRTFTQIAETQEAGITPGIGVRQGMPLSPLLANFSLSKFDKACKNAGIKVLRYADDILAFFATKPDAEKGFAVIRSALAQLELEVPELGSSKTELIGKRDPVTFLGREIVYLERQNSYVSRVGEKKLNAIKVDLTKEYALENIIGESRTLNEAVGSLAASLRSYLGTYKDAHNFLHFEGEIRHHFKAITSGWFVSLFGKSAIDALSQEHRIFLGIQSSQEIEPVEDIEIAT